jgi:hypothetical protein
MPALPPRAPAPASRETRCPKRGARKGVWGSFVAAKTGGAFTFAEGRTFPISVSTNHPAVDKQLIPCPAKPGQEIGFLSWENALRRYAAGDETKILFLPSASGKSPAG